MNLPRTYITGFGEYLPGEPISSVTLAEAAGFRSVGDWIDQYVGAKTRYLAFNIATHEPTETLADMSAAAARNALADAGAAAEDIDFVVLSTLTPDQLMPATVNRVTEMLGIDRIATYQLQCGCVGAMQALEVGRHLLRSGKGETGLVIGADLVSRFAQKKEAFAKLTSKEMINYALFGDGAGAAILSTKPNARAFEILECFTRGQGKGRPAGQEVNWFGPAGAQGRESAREDYKTIQESVPVLAREVLDELMADLKWTLDDVSYVLPPQLSGKMCETIDAALGLPAGKSVHCVGETGNSANGLAFLQLQRMSKLPDARSVLAISIESSKWLVAGLALRRVEDARR